MIRNTLNLIFIFNFFIGSEVSANTTSLPRNTDSITATTPNKTKPSEISRNSSILQKICGYEIDHQFERSIYHSILNATADFTKIKFNVELNFKNQLATGKLIFACPTSASHLPSDVVNAGSQITSLDAGGRYARVVEWERPIEGNGWSGTAAYVKSIFGDEQRLDINDFFLICPNNPKYVCFSIEFEDHRLTRSEAVDVLNLVRHIRLKN